MMVITKVATVIIPAQSDQTSLQYMTVITISLCDVTLVSEDAFQRLDESCLLMKVVY